MAADRDLTRRRRILAVVALLLVAIGVAGVLVPGWLLIRPHPTVVGPPPPELGATAVVIPPTSDAAAPLAGWFAPGVAGRGAVLLMHGIHADRRQMTGVARVLHREGFALLLFDFQAEGESAGDRITIGWRESRDARAALDFLRRAAPGEKIGAIGRSMGGAAALLGDGPLAVDALVLESVFPDLEQAVRARMRLELGPLGPPLAPLLLMQLPWRLGIDADALRPAEAVARLHAPLLVLCGTRDRFLPLDEARRVFTAAPEPKAFVAIDGADHEDLHAVQPSAWEAAVLPFLVEQLRR